MALRVVVTISLLTCGGVARPGGCLGRAGGPLCRCRPSRFPGPDPFGAFLLEVPLAGLTLLLRMLPLTIRLRSRGRMELLVFRGLAVPAVWRLTAVLCCTSSRAAATRRTPTRTCPCSWTCFPTSPSASGLRPGCLGALCFVLLAGCLFLWGRPLRLERGQPGETYLLMSRGLPFDCLPRALLVRRGALPEMTLDSLTLFSPMRTSWSMWTRRG